MSPRHSTSHPLLEEFATWLLLFAVLTIVLLAAYHAPEKPAPIQPRFSVHVPVREEEDDQDDLSTPGQYAANHPATNTP